MRASVLMGFLGAGKTTLLAHILDAGDERTAVIVNEFGAVGVDGAILAGRAIDLVELPSGCICCSLKGSLLSAIEELRETAAPERLIIEASGVAVPEDLLSALSRPSRAAGVVLAPVITIVDAARFRGMKAALGPFYAAQVSCADIVIVNKIDLAEAAEREAAASDIAALSPCASILFAERCDVAVAPLLEGRSKLDCTAIGEDAAPHDHADFESFMIDMPEAVRGREIERFLGSLPADVWRVKGFLDIDGATALVQFAGELEITPVPPRNRHYLVFIGGGLDRDRLAARLREAAIGSAA